MVLIGLISMILLFLCNFFSLLEGTELCNSNEIFCEDAHLTSTQVKWCCPVNKICGKNSKQCEIISNIEPFRYLIVILPIMIIAIFFCRCVILCLNCRNVQNETLSNNIYQSIVIIDSNIPIEEESPPSYEQVMNNHNSY